jgi:glycerol-3-phosphate dehydrogenase (NAD+)
MTLSCTIFTTKRILFVILIIMSSIISAAPHIAVIGSGNWGSAIARRVGLNLLETVDNNEQVVKMWVFEEEIGGHKLSDIINHRHENIKYLPGIILPVNVKACPNLLQTIEGANILLFVVPHQFLPSILKQLHGHVSKDTVCISLIKGVDMHHNYLRRFSDIIQHELHVEHVGVMMGANVASDVAQDHFAETTVACKDMNVARRIAALFHCDTFHVEVTDDVATVELLGALKNVIALGAGEHRRLSCHAVVVGSERPLWC